ncbi:MAG: RNA methyltransferase [Cyanobacteriota bacterium]|nr:RNA methyltransferase [Cyanobacteriota bacterium]
MRSSHPEAGGPIASTQNPLVKQIRKLHQAKYRHQQQLFLIEGTHTLEAACAVEHPLESVCHTARWAERHPELWDQAHQRAQRMAIVTPEVLKAVSTTVNPEGVVATAPRQAMPTAQLPLSGIGLALETLQDPGNLGTIVRTATAAGVEGLWTSADSVDLDHPKVLRASVGAWFRLPMAVSPDLTALVQQCQQQQIQVVAADAGGTQNYWQVDWCRPTLILLGNEGAGLSAELVARADRLVSIPLAPGVESLNVAIAAALLTYEACRQRRGRSRE